VSVFVDLARALQAVLAAGPPLFNGPVWRDRQSPVLKESQQAINVKMGSSDGASGGVTGSPTDWITDFEIECYSRVAAAVLPTDPTPTEVIDALLAGVWERLSTASARPEFIALAVQDVFPDPHIEWDLGEGDTPQIAAVFSVRIVHRTRPGQLVPWN
jgi:hypothetical protein